MSRVSHVAMSHSAAHLISANVTEGVIEKLRTYFLRYPNSKPRFACKALHLDPKRYGATARVVKSRVRKTWGGANIQADTLEALTSVHRQLWYLKGGVPSGPVLSAFVMAAEKGMKQDDTWYVSNNQNGQLNYRSRLLAIRILPSTRRLEVLCRIPGTRGTDVREEFQGILVSALEGRLPPDYEAHHLAEELSWKLAPKERHRRFEFPPGPYYRNRFYEDTFGLVIQNDLSEGVNQQEAIEKIPSWIPNLLQALERLAHYQRETSKNIAQLMDTLVRHQRLDVNDNVKDITASGDTQP
jgi:hypothetical protein